MFHLENVLDIFNLISMEFQLPMIMKMQFPSEDSSFIGGHFLNISRKFRNIQKHSKKHEMNFIS